MSKGISPSSQRHVKIKPILSLRKQSQSGICPVCGQDSPHGQDITIPTLPTDTFPNSVSFQKRCQKVTYANPTPPWVHGNLVHSHHHYWFKELGWTTQSSSWAVGPPALNATPLHRHQPLSERQSTERDKQPQLHVLELISCHPWSDAYYTQATE